MKWFLGTVFGVMAVVVATVVGLFVYVQVVLAPPNAGVASPPVTEPIGSSSTRSSAPPSTDTPSPVPARGEGATVAPTSSAPLPSPVIDQQKSIPLSSLPLSDTQKKLLAGVGIDSETFVITPAMITCANEKLGDTRMKEIIGGSAPGALEMASLMRCL